MKKTTSLPWILGSMDTIADYCVNEIISEDDIEGVESIWGSACELPYYYVKLMVQHRYDEVKNDIYGSIVGELEKGNITEAYKIYISNEWIAKVCNVQEYIQVGEYLKIMGR